MHRNPSLGKDDGNNAKVVEVVKQTGHITVRCLGKAVDSNGNIIRRSAVRHPTGLARKMDTLYEEEEDPSAREEIHGGGKDTLGAKNTHNSSSQSLSFNRQMWGTQQEREDACSNETDGNSVDSVPQSSSSCSPEVEPFKSPIQVLKQLADDFDVNVEYATVEYDPGDMNLPTYFECSVQAGSYNVKATSTIRKLAQLLAAQECLEMMRNHHPESQIPDWKRVEPMNPMMDPVYLLSQYCKNYRLPMATYACISMTTTKLHQCKCFWDKFYTEGQGTSKALAQRRAAFEMLDCIISQNNGGDSNCPPSLNHISLNPEIAKEIRKGLLAPEALPKDPVPFRVDRQNQGAPHPEVKVRYGYDPKAIAERRFLQFSAEYEATFRSVGDTATEAMSNCLSNAEGHTKDLFEFVKGVAVRKMQEQHKSTKS